MKALALSGGIGTRLRPLSRSMPKQLAPVGNRPVLFHCLNAPGAAGITGTGTMVSGSGVPIRKVVGDGLRGLTHCVTIARDFLADDDFVMSPAGNFFLQGIADHPDAQIVVAKVSDPSQYGVAHVDKKGRVTFLEEKSAQARSNLTVTGLYFFTPVIHEAVRNIRPSLRNELEITDAIQLLVEQGKNVGPSIIGARSFIENSYVGPFSSIGNDYFLSNSGAEGPALLERASIRGVCRIRDSLIGCVSSVRKLNRDPTHRLVVGDDSLVEIGMPSTFKDQP